MLLRIKHHFLKYARHQHFAAIITETPQSVSNQFLATSTKLLSLLRQCSCVRPLRQVHAQMVVHSLPKHNFILAKLILLKELEYSTLFFSQIPAPNEYAFNIMIRGLATTWNEFGTALQFHHKMKSLLLKPDNFTYPFVFMCCGSLSAMEYGRLGHCEVLKNGLFFYLHVGNSLISMYFRFGELEDAKKVFDDLIQPDLVSWNSMISGYSKRGLATEAVSLFWEMRNHGVQPDEMTVVSVLAACGDLGNLSLGRLIDDYVLEMHLEPNAYIGSALIDMYAKCGDLASARRVFDGIKNSDLVVWNAMITGYAQNGLADEAISLFCLMKKEGLKLDKITLVALLSACACIGALDMGKSLEKYASETGLKNDIYVATALIDMYAKCGTLDLAFGIFEEMPRRNKVSWNAMISALAFHGQGREALRQFDRMLQDQGVCPDDVTFIAVLAACVHVGLVDEGRKFFHLMSSFYGLTPKIEHYSCMVDLLSRAGYVEEAWNLIQSMPEKPDEVILGSLLGSSQKRKNLEVGERVMQLLLDMEPSNSGNYIISSKIYANERRWSDSARIRTLMRQNRVTKTPGCSWIEVNAQILEFHAGDLMHQQVSTINGVLETLYDIMITKEMSDPEIL